MSTCHCEGMTCWSWCSNYVSAEIWQRVTVCVTKTSHEDDQSVVFNLGLLEAPPCLFWPKCFWDKIDHNFVTKTSRTNPQCSTDLGLLNTPLCLSWPTLTDTQMGPTLVSGLFGSSISTDDIETRFLEWRKSFWPTANTRKTHNVIYLCIVHDLYLLSKHLKGIYEETCSDQK